jgi:hypothetical protein
MVENRQLSLLYRPSEALQATLQSNHLNFKKAFYWARRWLQRGRAHVKIVDAEALPELVAF